MLKKEELFVLIHSLSQAEKRYFRLFSQKNSNETAGSSNYLRLFAAIDAQEAYDEAALKRKFSGEAFVKQLHVTKNYLRSLILKALRNYHSKISKDAEVKDCLRSVEILFHKELYQHCEVELKRAEKLAVKYERDLALVEIHEWRRRLRQTKAPQDYATFRSILSDQMDAMKRVENRLDYRKLITEVGSAIVLRSSDEIPNLHWLDDAKHALSLEARVLHYNAAYFMNVRWRNRNDAEVILRELIASMDKEPHLVAEQPALYISSINNLIAYFTFSKRMEDALESVGKAREFYEKSRKPAGRSLLKQILRTYTMELEVYRETRLSGQKKERIAELETFLNAQGDKTPDDYRITFWFQLANLHFLNGDFGKALHWINELMSYRFQNLRMDLQMQARILNLMIHLELQNMFVLRYFVDSTRRFLQKSKDMPAYESLLMRFFSKIGKAPFFEHKDLFRKLKAELWPKDAPAMIPQSLAGYIDYEAWIARRLGE